MDLKLPVSKNPRLIAISVSMVLLVAPMWAATKKARRPMIRMQATAFVQHSKPTAAGTVAHEGIVAADPAVLPLGSRIRVTRAGAYNGIYTVTDTGSKVEGRHIDICLPTAAEAKQFGRKVVLVQILETGEGKQDARDKDIPARTASR